MLKNYLKFRLILCTTSSNELFITKCVQKSNKFRTTKTRVLVSFEISNNLPHRQVHLCKTTCMAEAISTSNLNSFNKAFKYLIV